MSLTFRYHTSADTSHDYFTDDFLRNSLNAFKEIINNPDFGFFHLTDKQEFLASTKEVLKKHPNKKNFVQIGIGGSALGPQMLISSLGKQSDKNFILLDNIDSDYIYESLQDIDFENTLFYVVSKSGGTAETIACYSIVRNLLLERGISENDFKKYFVFCTDKDGGQLRSYVNEKGFDSLVVPSDVGGRFSVLTHVGLLPALFFGINIDKLYSGANKLKNNLVSSDIKRNNLLQTAAHVAHLYFQNNVNQTVMMPYSSKLKDFSFWFVQLWAESLGKWSPTNDKPVGITPIPAYGATDQHSQMQLFMEGPTDKLMFMMHIKNREHNFKLDSNLNFDSAQKLASHTLNDLMQAEYNGSIKALLENKKNLIEIELERLNEESLGQLILFFESLTALMGHYLKIDPFNQPGVEKGKIYAFEYLNSFQK